MAYLWLALGIAKHKRIIKLGIADIVVASLQALVHNTLLILVLIIIVMA
jgi:hypothetical protein